MKYRTCSLAAGVLAALTAAHVQAAGPAPMAAAPTSIVPPTAGTPQVQAAVGNGPTQAGPAGAAGQMAIPSTNGQYGGYPGVPQNVGTPSNYQTTNPGFGSLPMNPGQFNQMPFNQNGLNQNGFNQYGLNQNGARFGNAPVGTPLGNLQMQTQGSSPPNYNPNAYNPNAYNSAGVNAGAQNFQNGAFEVGGSNQGNGGSYPPTYNGTNSPNNYNPGSYGAVYGYNPAPGVGNNGTYNPAPPVGLEQSASEGRFQYGWW